MGRVKVMDEVWDYLIVLDACRYDYFEVCWQTFLSGELSKQRSIGSTTPDWARKSFTQYYSDLIYISANPYINSFVPMRGFFAKEYFYKVYDLWRDQWDTQKQIVLPGIITKRAIEIIRANPNKRAVIHYMQPHAPYLGEGFEDLDYHAPEAALVQRIIDKADGVKSKAPFRDRIIHTLSRLSYRMGFRGRFSLRKVRALLDMKPMDQADAILRKWGKQRLREAYKENLNIVLKHVAILVDALSGKIVVTSDHGELLGEGGCYFHWGPSSNKFLIEVPWLIIDKGSRSTQYVEQVTENQQESSPKKLVGDKSDEEITREIKQKLRSLGYID